jgi:predicted metalloprotease with PDZ domain
MASKSRSRRVAVSQSNSVFLVGSQVLDTEKGDRQRRQPASQVRPEWKLATILGELVAVDPQLSLPANL